MALWLNRRAVLRGFSAGLSLPILECMLDTKGLLLRDGLAAGVAVPVRFLGFMVQNGPPKNIWNPTGTGSSFTLNKGLQPLAHLKADLNQITGLHANGLDSVFRHTDGQKGFWTGFPMHPNPPETDFTLGRGSAPSIENILGSKLGQGKTSFPSITASLPRGHSDRYQGSGASGDAGKNSWIADRIPQKYTDTPKKLYDLLLEKVAKTTTSEAPIDRKQLTILDFLMSDAKRLSTKLGTADRARLDQHLTALREIEQSLQVVQGMCAPFSGTIPEGLPSSFRQMDEAALPLMAKLIVWAFQCDLTRYVLFEVANVPAPNDNVATLNGDATDMWDHWVSHNKPKGTFATTDANDPDHVYIIQKKMTYWAQFLDAMKASPEGGQNILYNSVSVLGTDVAVGNDHNFDDMPLVTVGQAGGALKTGQHLNYPASTSFNNLHASVLTALGIPTSKFGVDGTGTLAGLLA